MAYTRERKKAIHFYFFLLFVIQTWFIAQFFLSPLLLLCWAAIQMTFTKNHHRIVVAAAIRLLGERHAYDAMNINK